MKSNFKRVLSSVLVIVLLLGIITVATRIPENIIDDPVPLGGKVLVNTTAVDKNVIPDKYNTGCTGTLKKFEITNKTITINDIVFSLVSNGAVVAFDYSRNYNAKGKYVFENIDFSNYSFTSYRSENFTDDVTLVFKNCKFSSITSHSKTYGDGNHLKYEFYNCTMNRFAGSNAIIDKCALGGTYKDGLVPFFDVKVSNSYFSRFDSDDVAGKGYHSDGTQIYGTDEGTIRNIVFDNCRFECPAVNYTEGTAGINACVMLQLEFGDANGITVKNCTLNGGGYSIYAWDKNKGYNLDNVKYENVKIGYSRMFGCLYSITSDKVKFKNVECADSLIVGSVWKDKKGTHISVSNDTGVKRTLGVYTDKGYSTYEIDACVGGDKIGNVSSFDKLPFDIDILINNDCKYVVCYDLTAPDNIMQIRFANWSNQNVYVDSNLKEKFSLNDNAGIIDKGKCGNNVSYVLDANGKLVISGTGAMNNYNSVNVAPWYSKFGNIISEVVIEDGVTSIGAQAFKGCDSISSITLGSDVKKIGKRAFYASSMISKIEINKNLEVVEDYAIDGILLKDVRFYGTKEDWGKINIGTGNASLVNNVSFVKKEDTNENISTGKCGENVKYALTKDGVLTLTGKGKTYNYHSGNRAPWWEHKDKIAKVVISDGITVMGNQLFYKCTNLVDVEIPDTVVTIGKNCLQGCKKIEKVSIPISVTKIMKYAFNATAIKEAKYDGTKEDWDKVDVEAYNDILVNNLIFLGDKK